MDFSKLDLGIAKDDKPKAIETTIETTLKAGDEVIKNGNGKDLKVTMLAPNSPEGIKQARLWEKKFGIGRVIDHVDATDAELQELLDRDDQSAYDLAARLVCGWNIETSDGKAVECSRENRLAVFKAHDVAAVAVMMRAQELAKEAGKSKAA